jgi:hypothetical protein
MPPTLTPLDTITLDAFLLALGQLDEPLPAALQERIQAIGHDLPNQVGHLDALAMNYPPLADRYSQARQDIQSASQTRKQRSSSPDAVRQDLRLAQLVLQAPDPIGTAKTLEALPAPEPISAELFNLALASRLSVSNELANLAYLADTLLNIRHRVEWELSRDVEPIRARDVEPIRATQLAPTELPIAAPNPAAPKLYRFTLPTHATAPQQQQFQTYITELKQLNPNWIVSPDRPQPGEAEAYIMIYNDDNYKVSLAAHIAGQLITDFVSNVCR